MAVRVLEGLIYVVQLQIRFHCKRTWHIVLACGSRAHLQQIPARMLLLYLDATGPHAFCSPTFVYEGVNASTFRPILERQGLHANGARAPAPSRRAPGYFVGQIFPTLFYTDVAFVAVPLITANDAVHGRRKCRSQPAPVFFLVLPIHEPFGCFNDPPIPISTFL